VQNQRFEMQLINYLVLVQLGTMIGEQTYREYVRNRIDELQNEIERKYFLQDVALNTNISKYRIIAIIVENLCL
jgi:hypothetical protein